MNKEVKEIIDYIKDDSKMLENCYYRLFKNERNVLIDYITSLEDKIDKAIEYCELNKEFTPRLVDVKDILKGSDKDE